ncbi:MAG: hypothetical protein RH945_06685 [Hyphomonas sp.]
MLKRLSELSKKHDDWIKREPIVAIPIMFLVCFVVAAAVVGIDEGLQFIVAMAVWFFGVGAIFQLFALLLRRPGASLFASAVYLFLAVALSLASYFLSPVGVILNAWLWVGIAMVLMLPAIALGSDRDEDS